MPRLEQFQRPSVSADDPCCDLQTSDWELAADSRQKRVVTSESQTWWLVDGIVAVLAPAAPALIVFFVVCLPLVMRHQAQVMHEANEELVWAYIVAVLSSPLLLLLGAITPLRGAMILDTPEPRVGTREALRRSIAKLKTFIAVLIFGVGFYFNAVTEVNVLNEFAESKLYGFLYLKLCFVLFTSVLSAGAACRDFPVPRLSVRVMLATVAFFKVLPGLVFLLGLFLFINNPSDRWLQWGLAPFERLILSSELVEVFVLALPSIQIELYALLRSFPLDDRDELLLSSIVSLIGAVMAFSALDARGTVLRRVSGIPTVLGAALSKSVGFLLVLMFRSSNLISRVLIFPLFQHASYNIISIMGISCGGVILFLADLAIQFCLVWHATKNVYKLPFAFANVFSCLEPLLHSGKPIFSVKISSWAAIHLVELGVVFSCTLILHREHVERLVHIVSSELLLHVLWFVCSLVQWPALLIMRSKYVCELQAEDSSPVVQLFSDDIPAKCGIEQKSLLAQGVYDEADARSPVVYAREIWWPSLRSDCGTWNGSLQGFGDLGARAIAAFAHDDLECKHLWLEMNAIGDVGARHLADMLVDNTTLEWLDLHWNLITNDGARCLIQALHRRPVRLRRLWLSANPITDHRIKVDLETLVDEVRIDVS
eukprot:TRINITY_DN21209_c0_g1_i1.p1 TRINITY_DN21209_c0_g1~~TRINITY_DN21209_c0_g1_i1.p1  ORF type:complete len:655 (-),score=71.29 TRINITY_DN21209_c0_g1_i1:35-1999(-)